jgi:hypothetical protein
MISAAGVKTFFKKNATPIVVAVVALTVIMLAWRFMNRENFAAPLPNIVSQIQTQYANEHARFKAALMLLKPVTGEQQNFVALAKTAMSGALKIAIYDPKDDRAQGPTVIAGAITYPWINSKGTAVVAKDDIEDNVAWAIAHYAGSPGGDLKLSPKRMAAYQYLTAQIPRAPAAKPTIATPSPTAAAAAATTAAATAAATTTATAVAAGAAAAAAAVKAAAAKKLADFEAAKKLVRPEDTVVGKVVRTDKPTGAGKMYSYTIEFTPKGKLKTSFVFQTTNANFGAAPKITLDRDGDVLMINGAPYGKWNPLG